MTRIDRAAPGSMPDLSSARPLNDRVASDILRYLLRSKSIGVRLPDGLGRLRLAPNAGSAAEASARNVNVPFDDHRLAPSKTYSLEEMLVLLAERDEDAKILYPRYVSMKQYLEKEYYPWIQASCPYYTDHGIGHINSVIQAASGLLQRHLNPEDGRLNAIEIFLVLAAILWHDVGNALNRAAHADLIPEMTAQVKRLGFPDPALHRIVVEIAQAHAGSEGLEKARAEADCVVHRTVTVYPRSLAAVVRFADEISENRSRISLALLPKVPEVQQIYWQYANCITASRPEPARERVVLTIEIPDTTAAAKFVCPSGLSERADSANSISLVEYLISRLEKMNNERAYCEPEFRKYASIREIEARLAIVSDTRTVKGYSLDIQLGGAGLAQGSYPAIELFNSFFDQHPSWKPAEISSAVESAPA